MLGYEPNLFSNLLLIIASSIGLFSFLPQLAQALKTKKTEDVAIWSYILWIIAYVTMTAYAFVFTKDMTYVILEALECLVCAITLIFILKYRKTKPKLEYYMTFPTRTGIRKMVETQRDE